jgi:hypothetical protein
VPSAYQGGVYLGNRFHPHPNWCDFRIRVSVASHWRTIHVPFAFHWRTQPSMGRARARPGEDWVHQWNANRTWMVHQWNSNGTWIPEITVLVEASRVPFLLLFHMQCQSNHPLYLLCHSSPSSDTVPLQLADCSCSIGQIALACKATPPSYALAEHCDPVLVQASYQASWDHDACRLRSLPAIPD